MFNTYIQQVDTVLFYSLFFKIVTRIDSSTREGFEINTVSDQGFLLSIWTATDANANRTLDSYEIYVTNGSCAKR